MSAVEYGLPVSCLRCGGSLSHVAGSTAAGTEASAIAACDDCGRQWQIVVHLRSVIGLAAQRRAMYRERGRAS